jgi:hypothetical protein
MISKNSNKILTKAQLEGQVGESAVWDGPLDLSNFPMGKGSSKGIYGMEVLKADCGCSNLQGPITSKCKSY